MLRLSVRPALPRGGQRDSRHGAGPSARRADPSPIPADNASQENSVWNSLPGPATVVLQLGAMLCGAAVGLLYLSALVWTARDIRARSRDGLIRLAAVLLVLLLNVVGLAIYVLLRPSETLAERYERELIEEVLAREVASRVRPVSRLQASPTGHRPSVEQPPTDAAP